MSFMVRLTFLFCAFILPRWARAEPISLVQTVLKGPGVKATMGL